MAKKKRSKKKAKKSKTLLPPPRIKHAGKQRKRRRDGSIDAKRYTAVETECTGCQMLFQKFPSHKWGDLCGSNCAAIEEEIAAEQQAAEAASVAEAA